MKILLAWHRNRDGATAVEYALIAGGIALVIIAGVFFLGDSLGLLFNTMADSMNEASTKI